MANSVKVPPPPEAPTAAELEPLWKAVDATFRQLVLNRAATASYGDALNGEFLIVWTRGGCFFVDTERKTVIPASSVSYAVPK